MSLIFVWGLDNMSLHVDKRARTKRTAAECFIEELDGGLTWVMNEMPWGATSIFHVSH